MTETSPLEIGQINDLFAEDVGRLEIMGGNVRVIYWRWRQHEGVWKRVALDWAIVLPLRSVRLPIEQWSNVQIVRPPLESGTRLQ